jgi:hypothetical protein
VVVLQGHLPVWSEKPEMFADPFPERIAGFAVGDAEFFRLRRQAE